MKEIQTEYDTSHQECLKIYKKICGNSVLFLQIKSLFCDILFQVLPLLYEMSIEIQVVKYLLITHPPRELLFTVIVATSC